jgi:mono/diheme cytochrome c family protein
MNKTVFVVVVVAPLVLAGAGPAPPQAKNRPAKEIPADVLKVFKASCASCHAGQKPPMGLSLVPGKIGAAIDAPSTEMPQLKLLDTANPEASYLLKKILGSGDISGAKMPGDEDLAEADLGILKTWILGLKKK